MLFLIKFVNDSRLFINVFYDDAFKSQFGSSAPNYVRTVVNHARSVLRWRSLTVPVEVVIVNIYRYSGQYAATDKNL